jgi:transposase
MMNKQIKTNNLDHLGLIAGICDDLEIENIIDGMIEKDVREKVSAGQIVKAIILNGLGFLSKPLYLFPQYFQDKPVEKLLGSGIKASEINDDKIGRVMDDIYELPSQLLWTKIGLNTIDKFDVLTKFSHLDSTSISVEGKYNSENNSPELSENIIKITKGYSRDKRPDLNQFMMDLMVSSDGDVPLFMRIGDGNESDKIVFPKFILEYQKNMNLETIYVGDSALYTAKNLHILKHFSWISRVPMTIKKAKEIVRKNVPSENWQISEILGYRYREEKVNYHGIEQRWLVVESDKRKESDLLKLEKKLSGEKNKIDKYLKVKRKKKEDLEKEIKELSQKLKYHELEKISYKPNKTKQNKVTYSCEIQYQENTEEMKWAKQEAGKFVLATNILDKEVLSSEEILREYKNQQSCERGFRFIKDPLFLASYVFVKNPKRVEVMGMIMGLCLLVYSIGQRMLRQELNKKKEMIKNQVNKWTNKPTLRWIFQRFQGIHQVCINGEEWINNLNEEREKILSYFSINCQKYYCN